MHFSLVAALVIIATSVSAAPAHPLSMRAGSCDINSCITALGPSFPACAPAIAAQGANTPSNTACLAAAAKGTAVFPPTCSACAAPFGVTDPGDKSQGAVTVNNPKGAAPAAGNHVKRAQSAKPPGGSPPPAPAPPPANGAPAVPAPAKRAQPAKPPAGSPPAPPLANGAPAVPAPAKNAKPKPAAPPAPRPRADSCDIKVCVVALGPSFPACAPAVAQLGANTPSNSACLTAAAKGTSPFPSACGGCAAQFEVTDPGSIVQTPAAGGNPIASNANANGHA